MSLVDELLASTSSGNGLFCFDGRRYNEVSYSELVRDAERVVGSLRLEGVTPGERVACVLTNSPAALSAILGIWMAGCVVLSLPVPSRGLSPEGYVELIDRLMRDADCRLLLRERRFGDALGNVGACSIDFEQAIRGKRATTYDVAALDDLAFVQYSSGSTSEPKGCMLTLGAVSSQARMLRERLEMDPDRDRGLIWLPLSHDMGLFGGFLTPWSCGMPVAMSTPERFLGSPSSWIADCARFAATITAAPSTALGMAARARAPETGLVAPLRAVVLGGERIDWDAIEASTSALAPAGLTGKTIIPAYGLAEATLAVTMAPLESPPSHLRLALGDLLEGKLRAVEAKESQAVCLVSNGAAIDGVSVRIDGDVIGEILVRSPSAFSGYIGDLASTDAGLRDGEVRTGDIGFLDDGDLYVVGRDDDMLSVAGRNVFAGPIEADLEQIAGVRFGSCVLIDVPIGTRSSVVAIAEPSLHAGGWEDLAEAVTRRAASGFGVTVDQCLFVERGSLPKTPSGKVQRYACRRLAVEPGEALLARIGGEVVTA